MNFVPRKNTPPGHTPPYDAYEAKYGASQAPIPAAFIGIQQRGGDAGTHVSDLEALFRESSGPALVERGWHKDTPNARTRVFWAYWESATDFERWREGRFREWLTGRSVLAGDVGLFIETAFVPPHRLDTLLASDVEFHGISKLSERVENTPYHGYWGGTRDRILDSADDPLSNPELSALTEPVQSPAGLGEIVAVTMPANVCVARGGPNWSAALDQEREIFLDQVYPALVAGARYLRDCPLEAGCYSACLVQEVDESGVEMERVNLHAYFVSLADLERWTRTHPTHLRIYYSYLNMISRIGKLPAINLYHEVSVIPEHSLSGVYVNCLPSTGFMRFGKRLEWELPA